MIVMGNIVVEDRELKERFVRAMGPDGENPRKKATAVELRFDIDASSLPPDVKARLIAIAGRWVTKTHVLVGVQPARRTSASLTGCNTASTRLASGDVIRPAAKCSAARATSAPSARSCVARPSSNT